MSRSPAVTADDLTFDAEGLDPQRAAAVYAEHGALLVRGLTAPWADRIRRDIEASIRIAESLLPQAEEVPEGWKTPDGTLWLPAPEGFHRDKQVMVTSCRYDTSGAFFASALEPKLLDLVEAIVGPNIELFSNGQCLNKEPTGGHPKMLHQDGAYFEHRYEGPVGVLCYAVPTDVNRGALHVVPGSHRLGILPHVDTESHLGLPLEEWPWERALPLEGEAGDAILFHVKTIHGSKPNHSDRARPVFIHRYRRCDDYKIVSASTAANREQAEAKAAEKRKADDVGFMVRGFRPWDDQAG